MKFLQDLADKLEQLGPVAKAAGNRADARACEIIGLLEDVNANLANLYPGADTFEYPRLPVPAAGMKAVEGRQGYIKEITNVAVVGAAATDVDIYVMSDDDAGFVRRVSLGAAGKTSQDVSIPVPEGQPIYVRASAAAQVNLIIKRVKP